jgi:hypothetical protein
MAKKLKEEFSRKVTTYAVLHFNMKEVDYGPDGRGPDSETVDIAKLGLKSAADIHDYVRSNKLYEAYSSYQVSTVVADGISHRSSQYNKTPKVWFGRVQAAEDMKVIKFIRDAGGKPVQDLEPLVDAQPGAKGRHFVRTDGWTIQMLEAGDQVFDKASNKRLWPLQAPQAAPKP